MANCITLLLQSLINPTPFLHPHTLMPSHSLSILHHQSLFNPVTNSVLLYPHTLMPSNYLHFQTILLLHLESQVLVTV